MGYCRDCLKPATTKYTSKRTGESFYLCKEHEKYYDEVQSGKNYGAGAGIG